MGNKEMIKVLEEEFRKTHEKLDRIEQELKRLEEEENEEKKRKAVASLDKILLKLSDDKEENSQVMQNDLIFTSTGELLNTTNKK